MKKALLLLILIMLPFCSYAAEMPQGGFPVSSAVSNPSVPAGVFPITTSTAPMPPAAPAPGTAITTYAPVFVYPPYPAAPPNAAVPSGAPAANMPVKNLPSVTIDAYEGSANEFNVKWDMLVPINGYILLGDGKLECTDKTIGYLNFKRDKTLYICRGSQRGWIPMIIEEKDGKQ